MLRRDYLARVIEDMGRIAARVRELLARGSTTNVETELQAGARLAGLELAAIRALSADSLLVLLRPHANADPARAEVVALVLELEAERLIAAGHTEEAGRIAAKAARIRAALSEKQPSR